MPYLLDTKIKVKFDGIKINTERQLFEGKLVTTYDKTEQNVFEVPIIKSIESAIKAIEKIFKNQKDITQKQKRLEKQLADNKIDKEKYTQESEKIKEEIAQNDKSLDAVSQYIKESPSLTEADKENTINQVNSFKSSGSKQSFDEGKADKLLTAFKDFKKRETEQFIADFERVIKDFESKEQSKTLFLEIELDTISKKVLDHKFAEHILPDKENDFLGNYFGDFKLAKEGSTRYVWEGNYWTKITDNGDDTYSAIVFSKISNDIIETVTWHKDDTQLIIAQKIKAGKDTADFIGKLVVVAPLIMDVNPTFGASSQFAMRAKIFTRVINHSSKPVSKLANAYEIAKNGGKHSGFYKQYIGKSKSEIQKGIQSIQKQIDEHLDKIANPEKHIPNFKQLDVRQQHNLMNKKWPNDIQRQQEQKQILEEILKTK